MFSDHPRTSFVDDEDDEDDESNAEDEDDIMHQDTSGLPQETSAMDVDFDFMEPVAGADQSDDDNVEC